MEPTSQDTTRDTKPVETIEELEAVIAASRQAHVETSSGCSCGWTPDAWRRDWPAGRLPIEPDLTWREHLDLEVLRKVHELIPSGASGEAAAAHEARLYRCIDWRDEHCDCDCSLWSPIEP